MKVPTYVVDLIKRHSRENSRSAIGFANNHSNLFKEVHDVLEASNQKYKQLADRRIRPTK